MKKKLLLVLVVFALSLGLVAPAKAGWFGDLYTKIKNIFNKEENLGFSVVTDYQKTLRISMTAAQDYVPVTSLTLKDDTVLDMTKFGDKVFLTIEPGKDKEEIVMCTGINTSSLNFTGCTRGLAFSGTSTAAVSGLAKTHSAGSNVTISNVHYVYQEFVDLDTTQTITGAKTWSGSALFYTFPLISSTGYTGLPTQDGQLATKYYVDTVGAGGFTSANVSTTRGLSVDGSSPEKVGINASSTTGMSFDSNGALYQSIGNALEYTGNAIAVSTSTIVSQIATSTPTANMIPIASSSGYLDSLWLSYQSYAFFGSGVDGDVVISASTTLTSDKYYTNLTINDGVVVNTANYRVFVKNKLTFLGTGKFASNGGAGGNGEKNNTAGGNGGSGGAGVPKGYFNTSTAGSAGGQGGSNSGGSFGDIGDAGAAGTAADSSVLGVNGVAGSGGTDACTGGRAGGAGAAGSGGNLPTYLYKYSNPTTTYSLDAINNFVWQDVYYLSSNPTTHALFAGAGAGGGGGGAGFQATGCACTSLQGAGGGGGGGAGGIIYISARQVYTTDNVFAEALGGVGGNAGGVPCAGAPTLGLGGGGGGGNGGLVVLIYNEFYGTGTATTTGGLGGLTGNLSTRSNTGNSGKYIFVKLDL